MKIARCAYIISILSSTLLLSVKSCKKNDQDVKFTGEETLLELEKLINSDDAFFELLERNELAITKAVNSNQITADYLENPLDSTYFISNFNLSNIDSDKLLKLINPRQDNRQDFYMIQNKEVKKKCLGVAGILYEKDILENQIIVTESYKNLKFQYNKEDKLLCTNVKFYEQKSAPFCTAFVVSEDIIITAGHCIDDNNIDSVVFIFDLMLESKNDNFSIVSSEQIYYPKEVLKRVYDTKNRIDYTVVELEEPVSPERVLDCSTNFKYKLGSNNYIIGHPSGLPMKYAPDGHITQRPSKYYFQTNLNAFSGNSGSPIFDEKTNSVIGIFIAGESNFTYNKKDDCVQVIDCYAKNCTKEIGIKLSNIGLNQFIE